MKVNFNINGVSKGNAGVNTEVAGEPMRASVPCLEVELIAADGMSGSLTLRFVGGSMQEAQDVFKPGKKISADFTAY